VLITGEDSKKIAAKTKKENKTKSKWDSKKIAAAVCAKSK
jgi:hypothetical protein